MRSLNSDQGSIRVTSSPIILWIIVVYWTSELAWTSMEETLYNIVTEYFMENDILSEVY